MKKINVLIALALMFPFFTNGYAQKDKGELKCKFDVEKKDAFTGADYKSVTLMFYASDHIKLHYYEFEFIKKDTNISLNISRSLDGRVVDIVPKDEELLVKLVNGSILKLYSLSETNGVVKVDANRIATNYKITIRLTKTDLEKISESALTIVKYSIGKNEIEDELPVKNGEKISHVCKCLLQ